MCPTSPRFRPTPQQTYALITVGFLSVGYALYLRYMIVENVQFGLNCDAGWPPWGGLSRKGGPAPEQRGVFGGCALATLGVFVWVAIAAAILNLVRPGVVLIALGLAATGLGLVMHNAGFAGLAAARLLRSRARPASASE